MPDHLLWFDGPTVVCSEVAREAQHAQIRAGSQNHRGGCQPRSAAGLLR